ncbi:hypothetical protein D9M72_362230 [compost metagenome]
MGAVFAREEAARQAEIADDADLLADAEVAHRSVETVAVVEIVFRLQHRIAGQAAIGGDIQRFTQLQGVQVRGTDGAHLALRQQLVVGGKRFFVGRVGIGPVREIKVDIIRLQTLQRILDPLQDPAARKSLAVGPEFGADLGDDDGLVARPARLLQPFADDRFGFAAVIARRPGGVDISRIDGVEPGIEKGVEQRKGGLFVGGPAEDIAAEDKGRNCQVGTAKSQFFHGFAPLDWMRAYRDREDCEGKDRAEKLTLSPVCRLFSAKRESRPERYQSLDRYVPRR